MLAAAYPGVAVEAVGIEAGRDVGLVVEGGIAAAHGAEELDTGLVPRGRQDGGLALGTHGAEEVDGFVVGIGQADRQHHVADADVEGGMDEARDVELLQSHFTALLQFGLVFAVLGVLQFEGRARAAGLKLDLCAQYPFGVELIVKGQHKAGDGDGVAVRLAVAVVAAVEAVDTVILESGHHFAIAAHAELLVIIFGRGRDLLLGLLHQTCLVGFPGFCLLRFFRPHLIEREEEAQHK